MARPKPPTRTLPDWAKPLPFIAFFAVIVGVIHWSGQSDRAASRDDQQAQRQAFAGMRLPQAIERCRELMGPRRESQRPVAVAWQPGRLDWYELRHVDRRVMSPFSCDGAQVWQGNGVRRVWSDRLPQIEGEEEPQTDLFQQLGRESSEGLQALEAALDPQPDADPPWVQRRWVSGAARPSHPQADSVPRLFAVQPPGLPAAPLLQPLPTINWLKNPQAAFELLARHVPANARVVELEMTDRQLSVAIAGPLPDATGRETSPFGEKAFDEFGTPRTPFWYPYAGGAGLCASGRPLAEVQDAFWVEWPKDASRVRGARFACGRSGRRSHGDELDGKWLVFQERRRR